MSFILKFVVFIFAISVVQSKKTVRDLKSFKLNENITYDCVDIYNQSSLSHPLLRNHKIQLKPFFSISKPKNQIRSRNESEKIIKCHTGTVPLLRNTNNYVTNAQYWAEKHVDPLTIKNPGIHIAGVRTQDEGPYCSLSAWLSTHDLNISKDQASYASIYVGTEAKNKINFIQAGWMVNPQLFGDGRTWSFGVWKGINGAGCYNTICSGFIQISKNVPLNRPLPYNPKGTKGIHIRIAQDQNSGNWWMTNINSDVPDENIGYWPKELFDLIDNGVNIVGVGGVVQASSSGVSPPMGNGHLPTQNDNESARVRRVEIIDYDLKTKESNKRRLIKLLDNDKCYGLKAGKKSVLFTYGGPGGDSCGI